MCTPSGVLLVPALLRGMGSGFGSRCACPPCSQPAQPSVAAGREPQVDTSHRLVHDNMLCVLVLYLKHGL